MNGTVNIKYFTNDKIDKVKWDGCISSAGNGLIYGYSFYLDKMAKHWDALVLGNYEAVMPLTRNKKFGIKYLYQPFLSAQLGVFGNNIDSLTLESFLKAIPEDFKYLDIYLNHGNVFAIDTFKLYQRNNYVLDLDKPYDQLYKNYRENIQRNIKKALQLGCRSGKGFDVEEVIALAVQQMRNRDKETNDNIDRFRKLYRLLNEKQMATTYGIFSAKEQLLASAVFFFSHSRAYYVLVGNHPDGKTIGASHALIDAFIKDYAGKDILLDFEGSDIRNLAFFYSSFGALEEKYAGLKLNRLPFYLKWLKK
ncbi:MAG: GNAT family N-acetyltransferase [Sphingobacteriales bacterium]|nr:GNAT family N-acetyltransferase [Sphingobacteriales bacterium]